MRGVGPDDPCFTTSRYCYVSQDRVRSISTTMRSCSRSPADWRGCLHRPGSYVAEKAGSTTGTFGSQHSLHPILSNTCIGTDYLRYIFTLWLLSDVLCMRKPGSQTFRTQTWFSQGLPPSPRIIQYEGICNTLLYPDISSNTVNSTQLTLTQLQNVSSMQASRVW